LSTADELVIPEAATVVTTGAAASPLVEMPNNTTNKATRKKDMDTYRPPGQNQARTVRKIAYRVERKEGSTLQPGVRILRHAVRILRHAVRTLRHAVRTLRHAVRTRRHAVRTCRHVLRTPDRAMTRREQL
jgi:hypothetical protein